MEIYFLNKEISVVLAGAMPVLETRGALPLALFYYGFSPLKAYLLAVLGNCIFILPVLFGLNRFSQFLMHKSYRINRFLTWLFERTRKKHADHFESYRFAALALFVFVAIPLPLTGAWSGIAAAVVFGISFWRAAAAIILGVLTSGAIVLALSHAGSQAGKFF